ncbi:MAG: DegV family EDD domain-containing protein [Oscillospiraceae bacterium]|jgi:DegV family protein with EDD domain|nr:DegV family EDD domain-containing protein [Oscillospiraceae bacterium]
MGHGIIVDSCCDLPNEMRRDMHAISVPLTLLLGDDEYVDDESLDVQIFMRAMKACKKKIHSAAPPPRLFQKAIQDSLAEYVITLSSKLSASYSSAVLGSEQAREVCGREAHVFDSKSACAGETLIALKLHELIAQEWPKARIIKAVQSFIDSMKTYFVLENYDNLQKNGRLNRIAGSLIHILNIKLIMGADGEGGIALFERARRGHGTIRQLLSLIERSGKNTADENMVISHCNNQEFAERLREEVRQAFQFKQVYIVPTGGLSSLYADEKGIVIAF